jgi:hypothetical protein
MRLRCRAHNQYEADRMRRATTEREEALSTVPGLTNDALASTPPAGSEKPRQLAPPGP